VPKASYRYVFAAPWFASEIRVTDPSSVPLVAVIRAASENADGLVDAGSVCVARLAGTA